ncbi:MAG: NEW3 domain-containing protein, partial [Dehalococcoidia bacterium]|nr:NEW3 domain-containing protein [Dehalococcoidia bacterium]
ILALLVLLAAVPGIPVSAQEKITDLSLRLVYDTFYNKIVPGEDNVYYMEVRNFGNQPLTNIRLSAIKYEPGWVIEIKPPQLNYLGPDSFQTVDVNIRPLPGTKGGVYQVTVMAEANEVRKVTDFVVEIEKKEGYWLWIGLALVAVLIAGFALIYIRQGRK